MAVTDILIIELVEASGPPPAPALDWIRAGALGAIGVTSFSAVRAVAIRAGDVVAVSGATGGAGGLAAQLARRAGARVLGIASAGQPRITAW